MKTIWTEQAIQDWQRIADYIFEHFGEQALLKFQKETIEQETNVTNFPNSGKLLLSNRRTKYTFRRLSVGKLSLMVYHVDSEIIYIDIFWGTRQSPKRLRERLSEV